MGGIGRKDLKQVLAGEIGRREGVIEKGLGAVEDFQSVVKFSETLELHARLESLKLELWASQS
jgi:hypothetical protein